MTNAQELNQKLLNRIKGKTDSSLLEWLYPALAGCMRYAEDYQRDRDPVALGELNLNLGIVNAVVDELVVRQQARDEEDNSR